MPIPSCCHTEKQLSPAPKYLGKQEQEVHFPEEGHWHCLLHRHLEGRGFGQLCFQRWGSHRWDVSSLSSLCFKNSDRSCSFLLWRKSSPSQGAQFFHSFQVEILLVGTTYMHAFIQLFPRIPQIPNEKVKFRIVFKYSKDQLKTAFPTKTTGVVLPLRGWDGDPEHSI